ncbi:MAG: MFS transporter [Gemmatimonadota bacterium]|nr:MAG: MFS transporter [Gemmatimonadota bacterium]
MRSVSRRAVGSWCLYDWANQGFATLVVTFIYSAYFVDAFAPDERVGTALWSRGIVVSSILIALLSPIMGAVADRSGSRKRWLFTTTLLCIAATVGLAFVRPSQANAVLIALTIFVIANVAYELSMVFYNAFLPDLAPQSHIGRISGYGWSLGYVGGVLCLVLALFAFVGLVGEPWFPLATEEGFNIRATNLLVGGWFLLFSIPLFLTVPDTKGSGSGVDLKGAWGDLKDTLLQITEYREVVKFLFARLVFNDGLVTVFAFASIYAMGTFGMSFSEVILFGIAISLTGAVGASAFGFFDDRLGAKMTILVSLVGLSAATVIAVVAPNRFWLWVGGLTVGIFAGPNQSASRSLMGRFVPQRHQSEFFGFFAFSGKATSFLGPLLLGILSQAYGQRVGVSSILIFFVVGGLLLLTVSEERGIEAAAP